MTDTPSPRKDAAPKDTLQRLLVDKAVGLLIAMGLSVLGVGGLELVAAWFERRDAAVLAAIPNVLVTWREPVDEQFWVLLLVLLGPMALVPGAFGARGGPAIWRWRMIALAAAVVACGVGLQALIGRPDLGVATPFGVSWLHDGKPREYWSWGATTSVGVGCGTQADQAQPSLNYDVTVPSGREANLARETTDIRKLVARLSPIDASLRARAVPRFAAADEACLKSFGQGLSATEQVAFRALFSR